MSLVCAGLRCYAEPSPWAAPCAPLTGGIFGLWCRNAALVKSHQNLGLGTAVFSVCAARGGSAALPAPRSSGVPSLSLRPSRQGSAGRQQPPLEQRWESAWCFPLFSPISSFHVNLLVWELTLMFSTIQDGRDVME